MRRCDLLELFGMIALASGLIMLGQQLLAQPGQATEPQALKAASAAAAPAPLTLRLSNITVIDGDTIKADVHLPYGVTLSQETIRASDYDAWESRRIRRSVGEITDAELANGKRSKAALQAYADDLKNPLTLLPPVDHTTAPELPGHHKIEWRDNYGRLLGQLWRRNRSIADDMHRNGHTRPTPLKQEQSHEPATF